MGDYQREHSRIFYDVLKRLLDIIFCLMSLCIAIPLIVLFAIAIKVESKGSCSYSQERVGRNGRCFTIYKLRSMYIDAEANGAKWAEKNDSRITRIGRFMRKTKIDELPQILNILKGDMGIVGPRPERPIFVEKFKMKIPRYEERHKVKCGLTGYAQVHGGYELSPEEKLKKDLYYIENRSIFMDLKLILRTVVVVITGKDAR